MPIRLQDPSAEVPQYLLEEVLAAARESDRGAAQFAFASRDGATLLLGDPDFQGLLERGPFDLVVGIDAITNTAAIARLRDFATAAPSLQVRVFVHDKEALYHPKVIWFAGSQGGTAFVGSGNLTPGGLAENWEAFARIPLAPDEVEALEAQWSAWCELHATELRGLADPVVDALAAANRTVRRPRRPPLVEADLATGQGDAVLIAEIPKASDRWKQANFDVGTFRGFFGADPNASHRIVLWRLDHSGVVTGVESRPTVSVRSHNYRIELDAATGLAYPPGPDRPIGVFLRTAPRRFRYELLMPGDAAYGSAIQLLNDAVGPATAARMRRHVFLPGDVEAAWPDAAVFVASTDAEEADVTETV